MPTHERFYLGTEWTMTGGPSHWMGQRVMVTGEVYYEDEDLWVAVAVVGHPKEQIVANLSWLS